MVSWHDIEEIIKLEDHSDRHGAGGADEVSISIDEYVTATTLTSYNRLVLADASANSIKLTLPAADLHTNRVYTVMKIDISGNKVTVDANEAEKINGETTVVLNLQYSYVTIVCDGTEWWIIGGGNVKLEELLKKKLDEQIELLEELKLELVWIRMHQAASISNLPNSEIERREVIMEAEED